MTTQTAIEVTFWGTRASYPFFSPDHVELGGDTSCIGLRYRDASLFIDGGTGLMHAEPTDGHDIILLSHFHLDHVLGLPYFLGKKRKRAGDLTLASANCSSVEDLIGRVNSVYGGVGFPVSLSLISPRMAFVQIPLSGTKIGPWKIGTTELNHPGRAFAYRIQPDGSPDSVVYLSDHEHGTDKDEALVEFSRNASLAIWDSSYDDREFSNYLGWGHSTWQQGVRFFKAAQLKRLALSHHDPSRSDAVARELAAQIDDPRVFLARDRMMVALEPQ